MGKKNKNNQSLLLFLFFFLFLFFSVFSFTLFLWGNVCFFSHFCNNLLRQRFLVQLPIISFFRRRKRQLKKEMIGSCTRNLWRRRLLQKWLKKQTLPQRNRVKLKTEKNKNKKKNKNKSRD